MYRPLLFKASMVFLSSLFLAPIDFLFAQVQHLAPAPSTFNANMSSQPQYFTGVNPGSNAPATMGLNTAAGTQQVVGVGGRPYGYSTYTGYGNYGGVRTGVGAGGYSNEWNRPYYERERIYYNNYYTAPYQYDYSSPYQYEYPYNYPSYPGSYYYDNSPGRAGVYFQLRR